MLLHIATSNPGKLRDFARAGNAFPNVCLTAIPNLSSVSPPVESARTFRGNALIKAAAYAPIVPGEIVLADDSGIIVPSLNGAPGVRSARYAEDECFAGGPDQTEDERNVDCLLSRLAGLRSDQRRASYRCVLVAVRGNEVLAIGTGELQGVLLNSPRGTFGFGYDPIFLIPSLGQTMAELDNETRLSVSHRGRALTDLVRELTAAGHL